VPATLRVGVPDLISPSYFPIIAAVELGYVADEGIDARIDLAFPVTGAAKALARGDLDFLGGAAHAPLYGFPGWRGVKLAAALAQNMYWFLVARTDLGVERGDLQALSGCTIGAAPGVREGLLALFAASGVDVEAAGIEVVPVPGATGADVSFGVTAARALAEGHIDAFWANGMGAHVAVVDGTGSVVVDARRDDTPGRHFTFPALAVADRTIAERPEVVRGVTRALVRAQNALAEDASQATIVGKRLFPDREATFIAELVRRDAPYYDPAITPEAVTELNRFGTSIGILPGPVAHEQVVLTDNAALWAEHHATPERSE
jgi:ABC-type nitrate/sulfonate/bicarbonate transport system substrate-binding protein